MDRVAPRRVVAADHRVVLEQEFIGPHTDAAGVLVATLARLIPSLQHTHIERRSRQDRAARPLEIAHRREHGAVALQGEHIQASRLVFIAHGLDFHRGADDRRGWQEVVIHIHKRCDREGEHGVGLSGTAREGVGREAGQPLGAFHLLQEIGDFLNVRVLLQFGQTGFPSGRHLPEHRGGLGGGELLQQGGNLSQLRHGGVRLLDQEGLPAEENRPWLVKFEQLRLQEDPLSLGPHKLVVGSFHLVRDDADRAIQFLLGRQGLAIHGRKKPCPVFGLRALGLHAHRGATLQILRGDLDLVEYHPVREEKLTKGIRIGELSRNPAP